jgi:hypothetical protein
LANTSGMHLAKRCRNLLLGITTRWAAGMSLFILFNLAIGGYYDAWLLPFFILNILFVTKPSGQWLGLDRMLARRYPLVSLIAAD